MSLSAAERVAWRAIQQHATRDEYAPTPSNNTHKLHQIHEDIQAISVTIAKMGNAKQYSWAQVAGFPQAAIPPRPLPSWTAREMLVTTLDGPQPDNAKSAAEIVNEIRSQPGGNGEILGARRLPSGAFALTF
jgi:hypothetical protein